ncbi:MAG: hypothetical protein Q9221_006561 [Calogaya cf. arnoldii]
MTDLDFDFWWETAWLPCSVPLSGLKKVMLPELKTNTLHLASYILVKTTSLRAPISLFEDEEGNTCQATIVLQDENHLLSEALAVAEIIVLKTPVCKLAKDGSKIIRIYHLTDIDVLDAHDFSLPAPWTSSGEDSSATDLKVLGDRHMQHKRYYDAIACYNRGLHITTSSDHIAAIRLNRCQARLAVQSLETALEDAQYVLSISPTSEKALLYCACTLYELERYDQCRLELQKLCKFHPHNRRATAEMERCQQRIQEAATGSYKFKNMIATAAKKMKNNQPPLIDAATYRGPIEVRKSSVHGYGLFTTREVQPGDLLLCEKAFFCAFSLANADQTRTRVRQFKQRQSAMSLADPLAAQIRDDEGSTQIDPIHVSLLLGSYHKVHRNLGIYHEPFSSLSPGDIDVVKAFPSALNSCLHHSIIEQNKFSQASADTLFTVHGGSRGEARDHDLPVEPVQHILQELQSTNPSIGSRSSGEDLIQSLESCRAKHPYLPPSTMGMWLLACRANHSCLPNVSRAFIGDMLILRASRSIAADSEILDSYTSGTAAYPTRREALERYDCQCKCALCGMDEMASDKVHGQREALSNALTLDLHSSWVTKEDEIDIWLKELHITYAPDFNGIPVPRPEMSLPLFCVVREFARRDLGQKVFKYGFQLLRSMGFVLDGDVHVGVTIHQWGVQTAFVVETLWYWRQATGKGGPGWNMIDAILRKAYLMEVGEDSSFDGSYNDSE